MKKTQRNFFDSIITLRFGRFRIVKRVYAVGTFRVSRRCRPLTTRPIDIRRSQYRVVSKGYCETDDGPWTWPITEVQWREMALADMKMPRWTSGVTEGDRTKNEKGGQDGTNRQRDTRKSRYGRDRRECEEYMSERLLAMKGKRTSERVQTGRYGHVGYNREPGKHPRPDGMQA